MGGFSNGSPVSGSAKKMLKLPEVGPSSEGLPIFPSLTMGSFSLSIIDSVAVAASS